MKCLTVRQASVYKQLEYDPVRRQFILTDHNGKWIAI